MKKRSKVGLALLLLMLIFGTLGAVQADDFGGTLFGGISCQGGYLGGETYWYPCGGSWGLELLGETSCYGSLDLSGGFGLRYRWSACGGWFTAGGGIGSNIYNYVPCGEKELVYKKAYLWTSFYRPCFFAKFYHDLTPECCLGKVNFSVDLRTAIGIEAAYFFESTPGSVYEELRGNLSFSLLHPCVFCREQTEYPQDLRLYVGAKIASCSDFYDRIIGLRWISSWGELRLETVLPQGSFWPTDFVLRFAFWK